MFQIEQTKSFPKNSKKYKLTNISIHSESTSAEENTLD